MKKFSSLKYHDIHVTVTARLTLWRPGGKATLPEGLRLKFSSGDFRRPNNNEFSVLGAEKSNPKPRRICLSRHVRSPKEASSASAMAWQDPPSRLELYVRTGELRSCPCPLASYEPVRPLGFRHRYCPTVVGCPACAVTMGSVGASLCLPKVGSMSKKHGHRRPVKSFEPRPTT
jgi:hypothetical protein